MEEVSMVFNQPKQKQKLQVEEEEETLLPMSPTSQYLSNSVLSLSVLCVFELETVLTEFETADIISNVILPLNRLFSSIIDIDEKGAPRWKKVEVRVEDHIIVPTFSTGLSTMEYDEKLTEYVTKLAGERLSSNKPSWEIHLVKYPNKNGAGSMVFKVGHALGDGYSLLYVMFSVFKRADDPSLPLTLPSMSMRVTGGEKSLWSYVSRCINTVSDLTFSGLKASFWEDSTSVVRSGALGVEFEPITISSVSLSMERLKEVKSKVGGTINDVVHGIIYYLIHLYMVRTGDICSGKHMNLLVMFNTRMVRGYKSIAEMFEAKIWGNHVAFLHAPIPSVSGGEEVDPLYFVIKAKEAMERNKNSMFTYLIKPIISALIYIRGPKGISKLSHTNFRNTTASVTSLIGPKEKIAIAGHQVGSCYFIVPGVPQNLIFTILSCTGQLRLVATMEKNFIDSQLLNECMNEAFENIYVAACGGGISP